MTTRRLTPFVALVLALGAVGCSGDDASDDGPTSSTEPPGTACREAVAAIVSATERYISGYEAGQELAATAPTTQAPETATTVPSDALTEAEFQTALTEADTTLQDGRCDPSIVRGDLTEALADVSAEGPVADAVLRQVTASITGRLARTPQVVTAAPGTDLRDVIAALPDGSTVELQAGEHRLDSSLVLLNGITIRGTGRDATTIVSTAPDAAVLALTDRPVELAALTLRREGDAPGSVVVGGSAASVAVSDARLAGGKADTEGQGGAGVVMYAVEQEAAERGATLEVTNTEVQGNETAGIVLSGGHRATIVGTAFRDNGECGVCFVGATGGSVDDSTFHDNRVGIDVTGSAKPTLRRLTIIGGEAGLQAGDQAAPVLDEVTVSGAGQAALIYAGEAAGRIDRLTCDDVPLGIVVGPQAHPAIADSDCAVTSSG